MKIVNIMGGLGNQMFQYSFALSLRHQTSIIVKLDISGYVNYELHYEIHNGFELENIFYLNESYSNSSERDAIYNCKTDLITRIHRKVSSNIKFGVIESKKDEFRFRSHLYLPLVGDCFYSGYWHSYKYFKYIEHILRARLVFPKLSEKENIELSERILQRESVAIHFRRGDYVANKTFGGICTLKYYEDAISLIKLKVENPLFIIFSNDLNWCKSNLKFNDAIFVNWNVEIKSFRDMQLMSMCNHNIISNSSFSWWGAWLNNNKNKIVISPNKWINNDHNIEDVIPPDWTLINVRE